MKKIEKTITLSVKPEELFKMLRAAKWESCADGGKNFTGLSIGGYCLTSEKDEGCSTHLKIRIEHPTSKEYFEVEGYSFPSIINTFESIGKNGDYFSANSETNFAGEKLCFRRTTMAEKYDITLEVV
ncbi:MAG: hypothetical protein WC414_01080 [Patescibacteria group bacterium]